jgi:nickel transport protein
MHDFLKKILLFTFLFIFLPVFSTYAHRLNIFAEIKDQDVIVSSYYSGSAKCKDCRVEIYSDGRKIEEGKTDENGIFQFKLKLPVSLKIVVSDRMGHRAEYEIKKDELPKNRR